MEAPFSKGRTVNIQIDAIHPSNVRLALDNMVIEGPALVMHGIGVLLCDRAMTILSSDGCLNEEAGRQIIESLGGKVGETSVAEITILPVRDEAGS